MANDASAAPILIVDGGVHRAASTTLGDGRNRVGPTPDNDIVITDLDPAGTPFALDCADGIVTIHALRAPVDLGRGTILPPGRSRRCRIGARFTSGGVAFRLEPPSQGSRPARPVGPRLMWSLPAVAAGLLCTALLSAFAASTVGPPAEASDISRETTGSIPVDHGSSQPGQTTATVLRNLRQHLSSAGLDAIVLAVQPEGSIEARGQITPQQDAAWRETGRWFDGASGGRAVLVDQVSVVAEAPPLRIQAVWPGHNPYVVDGSGDKLFIGTILPSGWTISGIDARHVLMKRGAQVLAVRF